MSRLKSSEERRREQAQFFEAVRNGYDPFNAFDNLQDHLGKPKVAQAKPYAKASAEFKRLLGPMVPALYRDSDGAMDVARIPAPNLPEFRKFLQDQAALNDGKSFRNPYEKLLQDPKYLGLFSMLYQEVDPKFSVLSLDPEEAEDLIKDFIQKLVAIDADKFVQGNLSSKEGRGVLRGLLGSNNITKELRADLSKAMGRLEEESAPFIENQVSMWNYFNWGVTEQEAHNAAFFALGALDTVADRERVETKLQEQAQKDPSRISTAGIKEALGRDISKAEIQAMLKCKEEKAQKHDPVSQLQVKLVELWLLAVDARRFNGSEGKNIGVWNAYILNNVESLLEESKYIVTESHLSRFNEKLQSFLKDPGKGDDSKILHFVKSQLEIKEGLQEVVAKQPENAKKVFQDILGISDEWRCAQAMGEKILPRQSIAKVEDAVLRKTLQDLHRMKNQLWYGYKQHRAISRGLSQLGSLVDYGNIQEIQNAGRYLDEKIGELISTKPEGRKKIVAGLYRAFQKEGVLYRALVAAEMDGTEQVLGLVQTIGIMAATAAVTRGANVVLRAGQASAEVAEGSLAAAEVGHLAERTGEGLASAAKLAKTGVDGLNLGDKMFRGLTMGVYLATAENALASTTGELRIGRETVLKWLKDAIATGAAMALVSPLATRAGETIQDNLIKDLAKRYLSGGPKGALHFLADTGLEAVEEVLDQYARQVLDGKIEALSLSEIEEITKICLASGGAKIGLLTEHLKGRHLNPTLAASPPQESQPKLGPLKQETPVKEYPASMPANDNAVPTIPLLAKWGGLAAGLSVFLQSDPVFAAAHANAWQSSTPVGLISGLLLGVGVGIIGIWFEKKSREENQSHAEGRNLFFDLIAESMPSGQEVTVFAQVVEHSVEDGILLAEKLSLTPKRIMAAVIQPGFALRHPKVFNRVFKHFIDGKTANEKIEMWRIRNEWGPSNQYWLEKYKLHRAARKDPIFKQIDDFYLDVFRRGNALQPSPLSPPKVERESSGGRLADRYLADLEELLEGRFYSGPVNRLLSDQGLNFKFEDSTVTVEQVRTLCGIHNFDIMEALDKLAPARVIAYRPLAALKRKAVKSELKRELHRFLPLGIGLELDPETDRYRMVDQWKQVIAEAEEPPVLGKITDSEKPILRFFLKGLLARDERSSFMTRAIFPEVAQKIRAYLGGDYLELVKAIGEKLDTLNLVHRPSLPEIREYFERKGKEKTGDAGGSFGERVQVSHAFWREIFGVTEMDEAAGRALLQSNPAIPDRAPDLLAEQLLRLMLPGAVQSRPSLWQNLKSGIFGSGSGEGPSLPEIFQEHSELMVKGGDAKSLADTRPLLRAREPMKAFLVTGIYGRFNHGAKSWEKAYFPVRREALEAADENTLTLIEVKGAGRVSLPLPLDARLITERLRGLTKEGREISLRSMMNSLGEAVVEVPGNVVEIRYSIEGPIALEPMAKVTAREFAGFTRGMERELGRDLTAPLARLPQDLSAQLRSPAFTALSPKEKVLRIEAMVRALGWYDVHNEEVAEEKIGKTPEEQMVIAEHRLEALRSKDPSIPPDKRFAGVCVDFAMLTIAMLREVGIPAGLLNGVNLSRQEAQVRHLHATAFVPWPDGKGGVRIIPVDGTPAGTDSALHAARPSLAELESQAQQEAAAQVADAKEILEGMIKAAKAQDPASIQQLRNGELESALNLILRHEVKHAHARVLRRVLEAYWYGGLNRMGAKPDDGDLRKFLVEEIERERLATDREDPSTAGGKFFLTTIREFAKKLQRGGVAASALEALGLIEKVGELAAPGFSDVERRALTAGVAYLRAYGPSL